MEQMLTHAVPKASLGDISVGGGTFTYNPTGSASGRGAGDVG